MNRNEIVRWFADGHFCLTNCGAMDYAVPTTKWLLGPCYSAFRARYWSLDLDKWQFKWECRDFAAAFRLFAVEEWARDTTHDASLGDCIAVGEIWFIPDATKPQSGHAICPAFTDEGLIFIEPQTGLKWPITPAQLASRSFLRF